MLDYTSGNDIQGDEMFKAICESPVALASEIKHHFNRRDYPRAMYFLGIYHTRYPDKPTPKLFEAIGLNPRQPPLTSKENKFIQEWTGA